MSGTLGAASPRGPRPKHQQSKSANQAPPNHDGKQPQRRQKGNRANNGNARYQHNGADVSPGKFAASAQDGAFAESAVLSGEEAPIMGPRNAKKHTQSQPSSDRIFNTTNTSAASLTDTELTVNSPSATPAKAQAAYAGPTFHASPAPSALPIPKFLSKSVPAKPRAAPPTPPEEGSDSASSPTPSPPTPSRAPIAVPPRNEDSPLDMLFKAHRAEKARNVNTSPASATFFNSLHEPSASTRPPHLKQNSYNSINGVFPIEMDGESKNRTPSPPVVSPVTHRSVTAPSRIPQVGNSVAPSNDASAIQDLLNRLSQSQKKPTASTPPGNLERIPSEPSSRHQTPSPFHDGSTSFRSTSGPTTPAPPAQEPPPDFLYGNRNLSPLFKAAKTDNPKRNSGLRTEITADSPIMPQGEFPPTNGPSKMDPHAFTRYARNDSFSDPTSPRRGSAPQIPPYRDSPNNRRMRTPNTTRTPNRRSYNARPDSYPHANSNGATNGASNTNIKPKAANPFIPSSVQAKQYSTTTTKAPDPLSLEQDLKRLLNLNIAGDTTGVR